MNLDISLRRAIPVGAKVETVPLADGWPVRRFVRAADATVRPRGSILFQGGRGDFFEKYLETFDHWHRAGWSVESFDWRGQGGSGRLTSGQNLGHVEDFSTWINDLAHYFAEWKARTPGPHVVIAHSMGCQILIRALGEKRIAPDSAVVIAPMLGFKSIVPNALGQRAASLMVRMTSPEKAGWRHSEKPGASEAYRSTLLTHSAERYADEQYWWDTNTSLRMGPASWRWIEAAYKSMIVASDPAFLARIDTPVLILSASDDKLVDPGAALHAARHIPTVSFHQYGKESAHEILREVDDVRDDALARIDAFLNQNAPEQRA